MRLGIAGVLPRSLDAIGVEQLTQVRELGFHGAAVTLQDTEPRADRRTIQRLRRECANSGVDIVELGLYRTNLVHPDSAQRTTLRQVEDTLNVAEELGCPTVIMGVGSMNPAGPWFPHSDNFTAETFDRLVSSLQALVPIAEKTGVRVALECHAATTARNAAVARDVLDAVGSPLVVANLDPVNWMTLETAYATAAAVDDMIKTLGAERIASVHSKGFRVESKLITHLSETHTGADDDIFDHGGALTVLDAAGSDWNLVVEHIALEAIPDAREFLLKRAEEVGVSLTS